MVVIVSLLNDKMIAAIKVFACESLVNYEFEQKKRSSFHVKRDRNVPLRQRVTSNGNLGKWS